MLTKAHTLLSLLLNIVYLNSNTNMYIGLFTAVFVRERTDVLTYHSLPLWLYSMQHSFPHSNSHNMLTVCMYMYMYVHVNMYMYIRASVTLVYLRIWTVGVLNFFP